MAVDISTETTIGRPREDVAAFAFDPANDAAWIGGVVEAKLLGDRPLTQGSRVARTARFMGRRIDYVTEAVAFEPPRLIEMQTSSPFPMRIRYEFEDASGGTLARIRVSGEPDGFFRLFGPLLGLMVKRNVSGDLRRLQALLEA